MNEAKADTGLNAIKKFSLSRLSLDNFRNYQHLALELDSTPVVITGPNGSGKTNILEAISFLSPGRGLRSIKLNLADKIQTHGAPRAWTILSHIKNGDEETIIGTGRQSAPDNKRIIKIDGEKIKNQSELAMAFSVMWQTPQMDGLFNGSNTDRRKFLDRLVYNFDPEHASRVYSYEYHMRERAKLLAQNGDSGWISILESKMAEKSISVTAARMESIDIIQQSIMQAPTEFPKATIGIEGVVEQILKDCGTAIKAEERLKELLYNSRRQDSLTGRTAIGVHKTDFTVIHLDKQMPASSCSTGEQKALLLSIILAEARAKAIWKNSAPVLLLDEVVAHLDANRRAALFNEFLHMGAQVWMTGTDISLFKELEGKAQFFSVADGVVA